MDKARFVVFTNMFTLFYSLNVYLTMIDNQVRDKPPYGIVVIYGIMVKAGYNVCCHNYMVSLLVRLTLDKGNYALSYYVHCEPSNISNHSETIITI